MKQLDPVRRATLILVSVVLLGRGASPAFAAPAGAETIQESPKHFQTGLSFGAYWLGDETIQSVYGSQGRFFPKLSFGFVPVSKIFHIETNFTLGFIQFQGSELFVSTGDASADKIWMTIFPIGVDLLVGVDIADEQPVVPYGGIGFAVTLWREHETGDGQEWTGDRFGYSGFFGVAVLLDWIERTRSRKLDASTGINDAFLTLEGRYSDVKRQIRDGVVTTEGLDFSGWSFTAGIKLVY